MICSDTHTHPFLCITRRVEFLFWVSANRIFCSPFHISNDWKNGPHLFHGFYGCYTLISGLMWGFAIKARAPTCSYHDESGPILIYWDGQVSTEDSRFCFLKAFSLLWVGPQKLTTEVITKHKINQNDLIQMKRISKPTFFCWKFKFTVTLNGQWQ